MLSRRPKAAASLKIKEERLDYIQNHVSTQCYLIGTASIDKVIDERLKAKGIRKLRVIDASVFSKHVSGNIII